jgi:hypothetical protein
MDVTKTIKLQFDKNQEIILGHVGYLKCLQVYETVYIDYDLENSEISTLTITMVVKPMSEREKRMALFKTGKGNNNQPTTK